MKIAIATSMGGYEHAQACDSVLASALRVRGADPEIILCDGALPACQMTKLSRVSIETLAASDQQDYCSVCFTRGVTNLSPLGHPIRMYTDYLTDEDRALAWKVASSIDPADVPGFVWRDMAIGEHAYAGALRFYARGDLQREPYAEPILRKYVASSMMTAIAAEAMIAQHGYDVLVANHGVYSPQGLMVEAARKAGVRVVTYNPAYRRHSFVFSHDASYHYTMVSEPVSTWADLQLGPRQRADLDQYMLSRRSGRNDWIWFHNQPVEDRRRVLRELDANPDKSYAILLTSVVWDAQLHYEANAFPDMMSWIAATVEHWGRRRDDLQLIIRVHPAELRGAVPSRQRVQDELAARFDTLPPNVFVVGPDNEASTYSLSDGAVAALIFNTKTGIEVSYAGIPAVVAGEAWIRGKGFAIDVGSPEEYEAVLSGLSADTARLDEEKRDLAEKYAYHFFFRRMIPLPFIAADGTAKFTLDLKAARDLAPGRWPGLDVICDGIVYGEPFIYPAETMSSPFGHEAETEAA